MHTLETCRKDFPILKRQIEGKPLIYFDNAATSQKPRVVIDALVEYYERYNANIHRGIHQLAEEATVMYEHARKTTQHFINAKHREEVIFTTGTTLGLNVLARAICRRFVGKDEEVLVTNGEHHANFVPWQQVCAERNAVFTVFELNEDGMIDLDKLEQVLAKKTVKVLAIAHISNVIGIINPIKKIIEIAHKHDVLVVVDGAQSVPHLKTDVQDLDADFLVFSAHKMLGPTGFGVIYGKMDLLSELEPVIWGGGMIDDVTVEKSTWAQLPDNFEAGTPPIAQAYAFEKAIEYLEVLGMDTILKHEQELAKYAINEMKKFNGIRFVGSVDTEDKIAVISFALEGIHPHDLASLLNSEGIAIRSGKHCAHPLISYLHIPAASRASLYIYNTKQEIDAFITAIEKALAFFEQ